MAIHTGLTHAPQLFDVCIVGAGPLGIAAALECEALGLTVLLLEGGGLTEADRRTEAADWEVKDLKRHAPVDIAVCQAVGGTSWWWGGRCVPMDPIDFEHRDFVPESGWVISDADIAPYEAAAAEYLDCGNADFVSPHPAWASLSGGVQVSSLERWSRARQLGRHHLDRLTDSRSIALCTHTRVVGIETANGAVTGLTVCDPAGEHLAMAKSYVLAGGGLAVAKLLQEHRVRSPESFGGAQGALGRYYMGHTHGKIADIVLADPEDAGSVDFFRDETDTWIRRRISIDSEAQKKRRILNTAFWVDNAPFHDYRHGSGILSAVYLALSIPPVGRVLVAEGIRRMHVGTGGNYLRHIGNVLMHPLSTAASAWQILRQRYLEKPRRPGFLVRNKAGRYALAYHGEQVPRRDSCALLQAGEGEGEGRFVIDLRFTQEDAESIVRAHEIVDRSLRASSKGYLDYHLPQEQRVDAVLAQASDGFHQEGLLRMGSDPASSVVDEQCRVHGLANLHVASTGVFPTSGQANPTFTACALAVRLAHFIAGKGSVRAAGQ